MLVTVPDGSVSPLSIRLFGPFEVCLSGRPLPRLRSRKGQWLLALLALRAGNRGLESGGIERAWLVGTLWPDSPEAAGFTNLRSSLKDLRRAMGSEAHRLCSPTPRTLCLELGGASVDVLTFDAGPARGDEVALEQAVALYRGPLLESCTEDWALPERQHREQAALAALETLAAKALARGEAAAAERYLRRAVALDPLRESAQRALMRTLAAGGNHAAAALAYRDLRLRLHRDINSAPDPETHALYEQIRMEGRRTGSHPAGEAGQRIAEGPVAPAANAPGRIAPRTAARRPAASTPRLYHHTLPVRRTPLVGRAHELQTLTQLIRNEEVGLVTLTGPGGSGKTRLAQQVAAGLHHEFEDGVLFVPLASLADPDLVAPTIAVALGAREESSQPPVGLLKERLREKQLLLLLDNFEHLVAAAPLVAELLEAAPGLKVLATSRAALHLRGEKEFYVLPLTLPPKAVMEALGAESHAKAPSSDSSTLSFQPSALLQYAAVELFVQRARDAKPEFALTHENAPAVVEICCRLDGLPLAIELAAARIRLLPPQALLARLAGVGIAASKEERRDEPGAPAVRSGCLQLLTGGARDAPARQQALWDTIAWSYDLLPEAEKRLFRRLSIFVGGCTLQAAEEVCSSLPGEAHLRSTELLDGVGALVDSSLLRPEEMPAGEPRIAMLETIREFGLECLPPGERVELRQRHLAHYALLVEQAEVGWTGHEQRIWYERIEREHDNIRAALDWAVESGTAELGLRLAGALWWFWITRFHSAEGWERLNRLLALPGAAERTALRAKAQAAAGLLAFFLGDAATTRSLSAESLAIGREINDGVSIAMSLRNLGHVAERQGDFTAARSYWEEGLATWSALGNRWGAAMSLSLLGEVARHQGDVRMARSLQEEALALRRKMEDREGIAWSLNYLAEVSVREQDLESARRLWRESLTIFRELDLWAQIPCLLSLERIAVQQGDHATARALNAEVLAISRGRGEKQSEARALFNQGEIARHQGGSGGASRGCE